MTGRLFGRTRGEAGYTAIEALTVVAAMGAVAALTAPSMLRFQSSQQVQDASARVGGMLQTVRARAIAESTPQLVLFQDEDVTGGSRTPFALLVSDNDRSYSLTPPDDVEAFTLDADTPAQVRQLGATTGGAFAAIAPAGGDHSSVAGLVSGAASGVGSLVSGLASASGGSGGSGLVGGLVSGLVSGLTSGSGSSGSGSSGSGSSGSGSSGSGSSGSGSSGSSASGSSGSSGGSLVDRLEHGTTFPLSSSDAAPALAFNEQGIPVSTDAPQEWGSGVGAVYLTDGENVVFAVAVTALGSVDVSRYDAATGTWK